MPPARSKQNLTEAERARLGPKERAERKKIANQKMALRVEGSEVYHLVKRLKLTVADVNAAFNCDAWYVKDEASGDVIWPENWQKELNPSTEQMPWRYMIVERDHFPRFDQSKTRAKFDGDAVIWLENVPYEAEAASVVAYLRAALEASLPHLEQERSKTESLLDKFLLVNAEWQDAEKQVHPIRARYMKLKQPAKNEEEAHYKALKCLELKGVADRAEERYNLAKEHTESLVASMRREGLLAEPIIRDPSMSKALWQITFHRADRANFCMINVGEDLFDALRLSQPLGLPPAVLLPVNGGPDPRTNLTDEVDMRGALLKRFRHGQGRERKVRYASESESETESDEDEAAAQVARRAARATAQAAAAQRAGNVVVQYEGGFQYGARHGESTSTVTFFYTLLGDYYQGTPTTAHELLYANGDKYSGSVAATYVNGRPASDLTTAFGSGGDEAYEAARYDHTPVPNGHGTMTFADGSSYVGEFRRGRATGLGQYVGAAGEVVEGQFLDGALAGPGRVAHDGMQEVGSFKAGLLEGEGLKLFKDKYLHEGNFAKGELHKYGRLETPDLRYCGWVEHYTPSDHGTCALGETRRVYSAASHTTSELPEHVVEGAWLGGRPVGRQSCVQTRRFAHAAPEQPLDAPHSAAGDDRTAAAVAAAQVELRKRKQAKERAGRAATQFSFQCDGVRQLGRRLIREGGRTARAQKALNERKLEIRRKHLKKADRANQDKFLSNVSRVLLSEEFDPFFGEDQGYGSDEEPGDPLKEVEVQAAVEVEVLDDKKGGKIKQAAPSKAAKLKGPPAVPKLALK